MTAKLIFKMEMFKFYKDKPYLIFASVLAALNILVTLIAVTTADSYLEGTFSIQTSGVEAALGTLVALIPLLVFGNIIFMFVYPFHAVAIDYKNNVMAMLFASGVNRNKLYFAKVGAIVLSTLLLSIGLTIVPTAIILFKVSTGVELKEVFRAISDFFGLVDIYSLQFFLMIILGYINMVVMIVFSGIFQKGAKLTFLVYVGLSIAASIVKGFFSVIPLSMNLGTGGYLFFEILWIVLSIVVFAFGSLKLLETQDL